MSADCNTLQSELKDARLQALGSWLLLADIAALVSKASAGQDHSTAAAAPTGPADSAAAGEPEGTAIAGEGTATAAERAGGAAV